MAFEIVNADARIRQHLDSTEEVFIHVNVFDKRFKSHCDFALGYSTISVAIVDTKLRQPSARHHCLAVIVPQG